MLNPYKNVVWPTHRHIKSLSHTHIAYQSPFDRAVELGYEHICATDYQPSAPRYPLSQHFTNIPNGVIGSPNSEKVNTIDSYHYNALGSFAEGHGHGVETEKIDYQTLFDEIFAGLQYPDGGGVTINHPVGRKLSQCCERLDYDSRVLGIEVYNSYYEKYVEGNSTRYPGFYKEMLKFWDSILSTGRRCFGFFVVDWFGVSTDCGSNMLVVPEFTENTEDNEHKCLKAYRDGSFYGMIKDTGLRFSSIEVQENNPIITASVNKTAELRVYTSNGLVKSTIGESISYTANETDVFVRVEATDTTDEEGSIYSNPIMFDAGDFNNNESAKESKNKKRILLLCGGY